MLALAHHFIAHSSQQNSPYCSEYTGLLHSLQAAGIIAPLPQLASKPAQVYACHIAYH